MDSAQKQGSGEDSGYDDGALDLSSHEPADQGQVGENDVQEQARRQIAGPGT